MKKLLYLISLSIILIASCNKEEIVVVSNFEENRLTIDGFLSNKLELQKFTVGLANNLGDSSSYPISGVSCIINSKSESFSFNLTEANQMISDVPFQALADTLYTLNYCFNNECGTKDFIIPTKVEPLDAFLADSSQSMGPFGLNLDITLSSEKAQWCRFEIFQLDSVGLGDSTWTNISRPIYEVYEVSSGTEHYILEQILPSKFNGPDSVLVKIKSYSLATEIGEYLNSLNTYMTGEFTGSQYQNPPNYFDDGTLGLIYGTTEDSIYLSY